MSELSVLMAQINPTVGAIQSNKNQIIKIIQQYQSNHDILLFPELALTGYPPEDLLLRPDFHRQVHQALLDIQKHCTANCHVIIGHPWLEENCFNSASILFRQTVLYRYHKQKLPNEGVFDEKRYFQPGESAFVFELKQQRIGICICEDLWQSGPVQQVIDAGATLLLCLNASPYESTKPAKREGLLKSYAQNGLSVVYVNLVGGQDELVFDGQSLVYNARGELIVKLPPFESALHTVTFPLATSLITPSVSDEALIYQALVCGLKDYVHKNGFDKVLLGLSGGIDSALTLAIAVDALGAANVHAVLMPSRYTADMSNQDALLQLQSQNVSHEILPIEPAFTSLLSTLSPSFQGTSPDITEENLQARIRGVLLMALSNKTGKLVLTTSNKSELAVGYSTLYGDMCGAFSVLKDVLKTEVYALARYRNTISPVIPQRVIERAPSAELAPNQKDQDSLPDYETLDAIIRLYMIKQLCITEIIQEGYDSKTVQKVVKLIRRNEYKRRQAAPGVKISERAFGRDWRYPITSNYTNEY